MHYRRQHKWRFSRRSILLILAVCLTLIVLVFGIAVPSFVQEILYTVATPLWRAHVHAASQLAGFPNMVRSKPELSKENALLRAALERANEQLADRALLIRENTELRTLLDRMPQGGRVAASVLLHPDASVYDTFVIDRGSRDGVTAGMSVYAGDRIYIGVVDEVQQATARVRLVSSPGEETNVVLGDSGITLTAVGEGGGMFVLAVPRDVAVSVGEELLLPGFGVTHVGTVGRIEHQPAEAFQDIHATLPINIYTIQDVFLGS